MRRVVVLGRGGAGKSTYARGLGRRLGIPVVELDTHFWSPTLEPLPPEQWAATQDTLAAAPQWIMDGDLGPYDVLAPRLRAADTVVVLDFSLARCGWQALSRGRERADFWWWVLTWRRVWRPRVLAAVAEHAAVARVHVARRPSELP